MSWLRILAEGAAIVASILLAFAIDAWWQERQIRDEEQEILQGLKEEFVSIHEILTRDKAAHLQHLQSLEDILLVLEQGQSKDVGAIVDAALLEMLYPGTSDLGSGALDALLNSGRAETLTNRTLRAKLAGWEGVISEVWDDQDANAKMVFEIFVPYFVSESVGVGALMRNWYDDWPLPAKSISDDSHAMKRLLEDPRFRVLAEVRYGYKRHLTGEFETAISEAEAILAEIEISIN